MPFKSKSCYGCVWGFEDAKPTFKTRPIIRATPFILSDNTFRFIKWVANYTMSPGAMVLKMAMALKKYDGASFENVHVMPQDFKLSAEQKKAASDIEKLNKPVLLDGITGSGKTEVYLEVASTILQQGGQVLILVPEIALTHQVISRIKRRFNNEPCVWHSKISAKQKQLAWHKALSGSPMIVIGARSALFLPFKNLGLIVVDEEHETSYKQDANVMYHARDMAIVRASLEPCKIILSSATPSIETFYNVKQGHFDSAALKYRYGESQYPTIEAVDLKKAPGLITQTLKHAIEQKLEQKKQVMLFLNRRGYAPTLLCRRCGFRLLCDNCHASLVFHKKYFMLRCHYCAHQEPYKTHHCPDCDNAALIPWGPGIEKVQEEVKNYFAKARVLVMTSDTITTVKKLDAALAQIHERAVDIIIGTQILAKGHHFPDLTLVGIIDADLGMNSIDFRAAEHTYQLLHQVAGRCGREEEKGHVIIQTFSDAQATIQALLNWDRQSFMEKELLEREKFTLPPFSWLGSIILSGKNEDDVRDFANHLKTLACKTPSIDILGPIPAPLALLQGLYRYRFLIKSHQKGFYLQHYIKTWLSGVQHDPRIKIDINPYNFY